MPLILIAEDDPSARAAIADALESAARFDDAYRSRHSLGPSSTINSAKKTLLEGGVVEHLDGRCALADLFFAEFLRHV